MKLKFSAYVVMMFGLSMLVTACGGGGGGGGVATTTIPVTAAKNPVLENSPVTITANFTNYTSTAKFGANRAQVGLPVTFTVPANATKNSQTAIKADFTSTVDVTAPAGTYTVSASLNTAAGNTSVTFIPQPGSVGVVIVPQLAFAGVGVVQCDVTNDSPVLFRKYSTAKGATLFPASNPVPSTPPSTLAANRVTAILLGTAPFNIAPTSTLFKLSYNITAGVPLFAVDSAPLTQVAQFFGPPPTDIAPTPVLLIKTTYFSGADETGTKLYTQP